MRWGLACQQAIERRALLLLIGLAAWTFGESRAVLRWAEARLRRIDGAAAAGRERRP